MEYRPCQVWGHDFTAFRRAGRDVLAILDLVSRKWVTTVVVVHQRGESEHVQAVYVRALESEGLLTEIEARMVAPNSSEQLPVLLAVSDGGPQMVSGTTGSSWPSTLSPCTSAGLVCPPTRPTSNRSSDTQKGNGHIWNRSETPLSCKPHWKRSGSNTTRSDSTPGSATSHPTTNTNREENRSASYDGKDSQRHEPPVSPTVETTDKTRPEVAGFFPPKVRH